MINKSSPKDFFKKGLPILNAEVTLRWLKYPDQVYSHIVYNDLLVINKHFNFHNVTNSNKYNWFFSNNFKCSIKNLLFSFQKNVPGFGTKHSANPYLKSILNEIWLKETDALSETCKNKFRTKDDLNQYLFFYWHLCKNYFYPKKHNDSKYFGINEENFNSIKNCIKYSKIKCLCLNDDKNTIELNNKIKEIFEKKFPEKSSFEK